MAAHGCSSSGVGLLSLRIGRTRIKQEDDEDFGLQDVRYTSLTIEETWEGTHSNLVYNFNLGAHHALARRKLVLWCRTKDHNIIVTIQ
jgi:hypothetical protein